MTFFFLFISVLVFLPFSSSHAYWVWSPEAGKFVNSEGAVQDASDEQYNSAMQFYREKNLNNAAEQLENLIKRQPNARIAAEAQYRLGTIYEEKGDYWKAFQTYKILVQTYPQSDRLSEVIEREFRIGNLFLSGKKGKLMGLEILPSLPRAVQVFKHIVEQAPFSDYGDKAQFHLGLAYKKWNHFDDAMQAFQAVLDQYPQSPLAPEARFQLAETSFARSTVEFRDQRALDDASSQVDSFLTHHPDANVSEKAAKLRQEIDEKNAEKNYRIGLYYEKQNYLESALIYYKDVAGRYPHTNWGEKSSQKLQSLQAPATYLTGQEQEIQKEVQVIETQLKAIPKGDSFEGGQLKRQLDRLKERQKSVEKNKGESMKRRKDDLKRREFELKGKFKNLAKKKKILKKNPSEDLKQALDRWTASLEAEQTALDEEKAQLNQWRETLGVKESRLTSLDFLPFIGEPPTALESVRSIESKKFYEISNDKKTLLSEKELLYKQLSEVGVLLKDVAAEFEGVTGERAELNEMTELNSEKLKERRAHLKEMEEEIVQLKKAIKVKKAAYEKQFGKQNWLSWTKVPAKVVTAPAGMMARSLNRSFQVLNPFDSSARDLKDQDLQELLEREMHLKEKIAAQQNLVDTLNQSFDTELALQEQKRLVRDLGQTQNVDPRQLRKSIKRLERDIRSRYEEIEDRHEKKKKLLKELDTLLKQKTVAEGSATPAASAVTRPFVGVAKLSKAFFFGLPNKDVTLTQSAEALDENSETAQRAKEIKEQIETESLLIEAKNNEITQLQKQLEILKAQASLAGGLKFRSAIVTVPYQFMKEAVESANRVVPKKNRQEVLIGLLDKESRELEAAKKELAQVEKIIRQHTALDKTLQEVKPIVTQPAKAKEDQQPGEKEKEEIQALMQKLESLRSAYRREKVFVDKEWKVLNRELGEGKYQKVLKQESRHTQKQEESLRKELKEIEEDIAHVIKKESELEKDEVSILEKRIQKVDKVVQKIHSKALAQDLMTERERMESRLSQLELRRDFLSKELQRFEAGEQGAVKS